MAMATTELAFLAWPKNISRDGWTTIATGAIVGLSWMWSRRRRLLNGSSDHDSVNADPGSHTYALPTRTRQLLSGGSGLCLCPTPHVGVPSYVWGHITRLGEMYDPNTRPDGYICLAIAENKSTMFDWMQSELQACAWAAVCVEGAGYNDCRGGHSFRAALAHTIQTHIAPTAKVDPDTICVAAGLSAVTGILFTIICGDGDACLIPSPYFSGFDHDMKARANVIPFPVPGDPSEHADEGICVTRLQDGWSRANIMGHNVGALLLTSPTNPSGRLMSREAIVAAIRWATSKGIHVVVDEVYACSVHIDASSPVFVSTLDILSTEFASDNRRLLVHVLVGTAKSWGVAGWRVGAVVSQHAGVCQAFSSMSHAAEASTLALETLARFFNRRQSSARYLKEHRESLRRSYAVACDALTVEHLPFVTAEAGVFMMIDLRAWLPEPTFDAEAFLWERIISEGGVNLTPGGAMHVGQPGWFRLCFAYVEAEAVALAIHRVAKVLNTPPTG